MMVTIITMIIMTMMMIDEYADGTDDVVDKTTAAMAVNVTRDNVLSMISRPLP